MRFTSKAVIKVLRAGWDLIKPFKPAYKEGTFTCPQCGLTYNKWEFMSYSPCDNCCWTNKDEKRLVKIAAKLVRQHKVA